MIPRLHLDSEEVEPLEILLNANGSMRMTADGDIDFGGDDKTGPQTEYPYLEKRTWNLGIALAAEALHLDLEKPDILNDRIVLHGANGLSRTIPLDDAGFFYIDWSLRFDDLKERQNANLLWAVVAGIDQRFFESA